MNHSSVFIDVLLLIVKFIFVVYIRRTTCLILLVNVIIISD